MFGKVEEEMRVVRKKSKNRKQKLLKHNKVVSSYKISVIK